MPEEFEPEDIRPTPRTPANSNVKPEPTDGMREFLARSAEALAEVGKLGMAAIRRGGGAVGGVFGMLFMLSPSETGAEARGTLPGGTEYRWITDTALPRSGPGPARSSQSADGRCL